LISGLEHFNVDTDSRALQQNLALLLQGVREAFVASGIAIFAAMLITLIEKGLLNWCYKRTEALAQAVDELYEAGAGEEYLSRLVKSSEDNTTQTKQLKDALVNDLKELLTNFSGSLAQAVEHGLQQHSQRLIEAQGSANVELSTAVTQAIASSLNEPMQTIAKATRTLGGNQGEALNDLLAATIAKLEGTLGGQTRGLNELMAENARLMQGMQASFENLLGKMAATGDNANKALAEQLRQLTTEAEQRQKAMNDTLLGLLDQLRDSMAKAQQTSTTQLNESLAGITTAVARLMDDLAKQREAMNDTGRQSLDNLREGLGALIEEIRASSTKTSELYGTELQKLFAQSESRQQELNAQVRGLVEQMQRDQAVRQVAAGNVLEKTLSAIQTRIEAADEHNTKRQQAKDEETKVLLEQLASQVVNLNSAVSQGTTAMNAAIQRLEAVSVSGANSLTQAASGISEAGTRVGQVLDKVAEVQGQITQVSHSLGEASGTIRQLLNSYQEQRTQIENMIVTLRGLISDADQRAAMSKELVNEIQRVKDNVQALLTGLSDHIKQVNDTLIKSFDQYTQAVNTKIGKVLGEFDEQLAKAVKMISTQIQELEGALDQLVSAINRKGN
jgi:chromosome segregation ATPase